MAAPSPRIRPVRFFENGRHVSDATTRIASQAFKCPKEIGASLPPASAQLSVPCRINQNACPIAWFAEEQAVEVVTVAPVNFCSIATWLATALLILRGTAVGEQRDFFSCSHP